MAQSQAALLAERLCRPQHLGIFGHRNVGKTTLLTLLYREAVGGRLPGLRLAAADARTAGYLADKILQLEQGQPLPATLAETELRFSLYAPDARLELVVKDYQGEHVALGRSEPIRDFLRDCDAVWLCLDVPVLGTRIDNLTAEMEVQQLVEDHLTAEPGGENARPMALVLTKADQLPGSHVPTSERLADSLPMTRTALTQHSPQHAMLAVSSLGGDLKPGHLLAPQGFESLLTWLLHALQAQDEARLERIFALAPRDVGLLARCVACFARRYPTAPATADYQRRLAAARRSVWQRRLVGAAALLLGLFGTAYAYDTLAAASAQRFEQDNRHDLGAVVARWHGFHTWHPTWPYLAPTTARDQRDHLRHLEAELRTEQMQARLEAIRRAASDPDADMEKVWARYKSLQEDYPEADFDSPNQTFRDLLKQRRDADRERRADRAFQELTAAETREDAPALVARADAFLKDHAGTRRVADVEARLSRYLAGVDERDIEAARTYRARQPINFHTQRENFLRYLEKHPEGSHVSEAKLALDAIAFDWDKHDYKAVRDLFVSKPAEVKDIDTLGRTYLASHPQGHYRAAVQELLRWLERVSVRQGYKVRLRSGSLDKGQVLTLSRGMNPSVEVEVNGVIYGPSTIASRTSEPVWDYDFPRPIQWKLGDKVTIRVTDHYFWNRSIGQIDSGDDPVGIALLAGSAANGKTTLTFESDFALPKMPQPE